MTEKNKFNVVVVGGGTAGITTAARLLRVGVKDIAIVEPSEVHYYQPLWTLVGGGLVKQSTTLRAMAKVMPDKAAWIKDRAIGADPESNSFALANGREISYDWAVVAPGIQLNFNKIPGLEEAVGKDVVSSNYRFDLAPKTWENIKATTSGTAIFNMPTGAIKCAGAPQKIAYLAADYWQRKGVLDKIRIVLVLPGPGIFGVPEFAKPLLEVVKRYNIEVRYSSEIVSVDGPNRRVQIKNLANPDAPLEEMSYDFAHFVPPQSAPDWIRESKLADTANPAGYVEVDKNSLQHVRYPNVFAIGDAGSTPNSKTGAAIRKQAPVVVSQMTYAMGIQSGKPKQYDGYASCPLVTSHNRCIMAEFDYKPQPTPTFPVLNMQKERWDMFMVKRYGLPAMYWNAMLKGLA